MRKLALSLVLAASLWPALASAEVDLQIHLGLPVAPPLVVVQPGIQVVPAYEEEVFFHRGWYWARRGPYWYRAQGPQAAFVYVEPRFVPAPLVRLPPPGHYRQYRAAERHERHAWREHEKAERKAWKAREKDERRARRDAEKERHREHGNGHGHGHD